MSEAELVPCPCLAHIQDSLLLREWHTFPIRSKPLSGQLYLLATFHICHLLFMAFHVTLLSKELFQVPLNCLPSILSLMCVLEEGKVGKGNAYRLTGLRMKNTFLNNDQQGPYGLPLLFLSLVSPPTTLPFASCFAVITTSSVLGNQVLFCLRAFARTTFPCQECPTSSDPQPASLLTLKNASLFFSSSALPLPETLSLDSMLNCLTVHTESISTSPHSSE